MSVIYTRINKPRSCGPCNLCPEWMNRNWGCQSPVDCPLKSVEGLIEKIQSLHTQESVDGQDMLQAYDVIRTIKEYCGGDAE